MLVRVILVRAVLLKLLPTRVKLPSLVDDQVHQLHEAVPHPLELLEGERSSVPEGGDLAEHFGAALTDDVEEVVFLILAVRVEVFLIIRLDFLFLFLLSLILFHFLCWGIGLHLRLSQSLFFFNLFL